MKNAFLKPLYLACSLALCTHPLLGMENTDREMASGGMKRKLESDTVVNITIGNIPKQENSQVVANQTTQSQGDEDGVTIFYAPLEIQNYIIFNNILDGHGALNIQYFKLVRSVCNLWKNWVDQAFMPAHMSNALTNNELGMYPSLTYLALNNPNITSEALTCLTALKSLFLLTDAKIESGEGIWTLTTLTHLCEDQDVGTEFKDEDLEELTSLTSLKLTKNDLIEGSGLKGLTNLTHLHVEDMYLFDPANLHGLTKLTTLWLEPGDNPSSGLTNDVLKGLPKLTALTMIRWDDVLDDGLESLANLTELTWDTEQEMDILSKLTKLTNLSLRALLEDQITDSIISHLTNLNTLSLKYCGGDDLNQSITGKGFIPLVKLEMLRINKWVINLRDRESTIRELTQTMDLNEFIERCVDVSDTVDFLAEQDTDRFKAG